MPIVNDEAAGYQTNNKAYKLFIALHLQYCVEIKIEEHTAFPACHTLVNQKMQIGIWKTGKVDNALRVLT